VLREVIRLKALMPADTGSRVMAEQFHRLHAGKSNGETVGRTWVSEHLKKHRYAVLQLRRRLKHTKPRPLPAHKIWAMDMTGVPDHAQESQTVLGIIDHGSPWLLGLRRLRTKSSIALLRALLDAIEAHDFQKPERLRTDNETVFTSRVFRFGLWWLGIRHQRTDKGCPWMNGRIERLFGTFKDKSKGLLFDTDALPAQLQLFRFWYNRVRPHQYLDGRTPWEVLNRVPAQWAADTAREPKWFEAWNRRLGGYWVPPG
jgi:transposase InsO family protein